MYSIATGPGIQPSGVIANMSTTFYISAMNSLGVPQQNGGDNFTLTFVSGPVTSIITSIMYSGNGLYEVNYTSPLAGTYVLRVAKDGIFPIFGSDFVVSVTLASMNSRFCFFANWRVEIKDYYNY